MSTQITEETYKRHGLSGRNQVQEKASEWRWYHLLPVAAAAIYIFTPILTWQFGVPGAIKFLGDVLVIGMIGLAIGRMMVTDRILGAFLAIVALTFVGAVVAAFAGQSSGVTFYGWWMMFRFPMVGLYVYLVPSWPRGIAALLPKLLVWILGLQVIAQIGLYLTGIRSFDDLGGTFGKNGVGPLIFFVLLVLSFALGNWLIKEDWKLLAATLALGSFASALGEMKLFAIAAPVMAVVIVGIQNLRGRNSKQLLLFVLFFVVAGTSFYFAYRKFLVEDLDIRPLENFLESDERDLYLDQVLLIEGGWHMGRNAEAEYGWQLIQKDNVSMLFGYGLGTRQHSAQFGMIGIGVLQSLYGLYVGRSLMVMMYEMGIAGLTILLCFVIISVVYLYRATRRDADQDMNVIRIGVLLYTLFWPLWIWYSAVWNLPAPSILYWMIWGYAMHYSIGHSFQQTPSGSL